MQIEEVGKCERRLQVVYQYLEMSQFGAGLFFGGKKSPKGDTAQIFW
jgi:hypothetical protein